MHSVSTALIATTVQFLPGQKETLGKGQRKEEKPPMLMSFIRHHGCKIWKRHQYSLSRLCPLGIADIQARKLSGWLVGGEERGKYIRNIKISVQSRLLPLSQKTNRMKLPSKIQLLNSPFLYDLLRVFSHVVVTDDMIQAGQGLLHVLLQALQILCLFMDRDDRVLQFHQTAFKGG